MARATVRHVAERAGVSTMTVSRIVRGNHDAVSPQKRALVLEAIRELDYVPVRPAFQNRRSETRIIGLVVDMVFKHKGLVASNTSEGVREAAFNSGYDVLLMRSKPISSLDEQKSQLLDRRCDGYIFISPRERQEVLEKLVHQEIPTVSCFSADVPEGIAWVVPDNHGAIQRAVQEVAGLGHRKIGYIAGSQKQYSGWHRREAYEQTMQSLGLEPHWMEMTLPEEGTKAAEFVRQHNATAVVCHNDHWALQLWNHLTELGIRVPDDISLTGIDDTPDAAQRGLTTFVNPYEKIGQTAVESLLHLLKGGDVQEACHTLPTPMVARNSVAPPRSS